MERIAIFSDVHGNLTALDSVLADIEARGIKRIFCLGDSIFKSANPDIVLERLKTVCEVVLLGNSDYNICRPEVKDRNFWTRNKIGEDNVEYILNLPKFHEIYMSGHFIRFFHASPHSLEDIYNPMYPNIDLLNPKNVLPSPEDLFKNTDFLGKDENDKIPDIVIYGHIHTPCIVRHKNKTLINTGSVGSPVEMLNKNEDLESNKFSTLASYIILEGNYDSKDISSISFQLVRVPYDIEKEITFIQESSMPNKEIFISTLRTASPTIYK